MNNSPKLFSDNNPLPAIILFFLMMYGLVADSSIMIIAFLANLYLLYDALREDPVEAADNAYYNDGEPTMTDDEYDDMKRENPSESVGSPVVGGEKHTTRMLSLSNAIDEEELSDFFDTVTSTIGTSEFIVEPKIDGLALNCTYSGGVLVSAVTRGDGLAGKDVTKKVRQILPRSVKFDALEVRGEVYLPKKELKAINAGRVAMNKKPFASCQSAATATLMHENAAVCRARKIKFVAYDVGYGKRDIASNQAALVAVLKRLGFAVLDHSKVRTFEGMIRACKRIFAETKFPADGVVLKLSDFDGQNAISHTDQAPLWAIAWKGDQQAY